MQSHWVGKIFWLQRIEWADETYSKAVSLRIIKTTSSALTTEDFVSKIPVMISTCQLIAVNATPILGFGI
jgi:hypothetical protein